MFGHKNINNMTPEQQEEERKRIESQIKMPIRNNPPFKTHFNEITPDSSKYDIPPIPVQKDNKQPHNYNFSISANKSGFNFFDEINDIPLRIALPTNRKQREDSMLPYRNNNLLKEQAQINQPEQRRSEWIFIFAVFSFCFILLIVFNLFIFGGTIYLSTIFLAIIFFILAILGYKAQQRRLKLPYPQFPKYSLNEGEQFEDSEEMEYSSAMFAKDPTELKTDTIIDLSLSNSSPYSMADRASAEIFKDQMGKKIDYDQLASETLRTLDISPPAFNRYLNNFKGFIPKIILSKLIKEMHSSDSEIVAMLVVPGFERYKNYITNRITTLGNSHYLAVHLGDKGARYNDREWTTDFPSDNQIVLHILDVWLSKFMNGKRKGGSQSLFTQKYVFIKREPEEKDEDSIYLCSDDSSHFYVSAVFNENKGRQKFYAPSGKDAMYAGLTLFFWLIMKKKNAQLDSADLKSIPICMDRILSSSTLDF